MEASSDDNRVMPSTYQKKLFVDSMVRDLADHQTPYSYRAIAIETAMAVALNDLDKAGIQKAYARAVDLVILARETGHSA